jgi:hypothetical protein
MRPNRRQTNHDKLADALRHHVGKELSTAHIAEIVQSVYPNFPAGSVLPNDHADGNKSCCKCATTPQRIFDRVKVGVYRVRPV